MNCPLTGFDCLTCEIDCQLAQKRYRERPDAASITCPKCGRESWHPMDVEQRFCAACGFHDTFEVEIGT